MSGFGSQPSIVHNPSVPSSIQVHVLQPSPAGTASPGVVHFVVSWAEISIEI